ncbi:MAG: NADH-quinone oxidoreductase subunit H [Victivallaceae bacterium]|nr:NADH-quinone oxidoreductase subunit H [Victivallaceae bacterium]
MALFCLNILLLIFAPLLMAGIIKRVKALWSGNKGPSLFQPFHDIFRLLKKGEVISSASSFVFSAAPVVSLAAVITAALFVPLAGRQAFLSFNGDFLAFSYLLALGKFFMIAGAMDTGSSFEGMGGSREAAFSTVAEPGFLILLASLSLAAGCKSFSDVFSVLHGAGSFNFILAALVSLSLFIFILAEACRIPVDDPETHLELTMIHEVMVLDNSGPGFAFMVYGNYLKMFLLASLIASALLPQDWPPAAEISLFAGAVAAVAVPTGALESVMARLRMTHTPQLLFMIPVTGMVVFFIVITGIKKLL